MADNELRLKNHYGIDTLYPAEWPKDRDEDEDENDGDEEELPKTSTSRPIRRSKSRYSALERGASYRSSIPGSEKTKDGVENLVQKDEPDPLGTSASVVQVLRQRGLPVEDDLKLRNRFLLSSTTFSPTLFLSQVHNDASTESLLQGLDFLSRSIEKKSASLKVLVESNFERFVRAKATIDNVYTEMRNQGQEDEPQPRARPHSRHMSKSSGHFRNISGSLSAGLGSNKPISNDKKKHALTKETEYGVQGIKVPLLEVAVKAEEVWGPALGGREREENLKAVLATVERNRGLFEIGASIQNCIKRKDYGGLVGEYAKANSYADEAKDMASTAVQNRAVLTDAQIHQIIVTARMWTDVQSQIGAFKRDVWRKLAGTHFTKQPAADEDQREAHTELINLLLELGTDDNPIWIWLLSRYDFLKSRISSTSERFRVEMEILRRRLANGEKPNLRQFAQHVRSAGNQGRATSGFSHDSPKVIEFWEHMLVSLNALLSPHGGMFGEVIEYWETAQSYIDGKAQRNLPNGINGQSRHHHRLSVDGVRDLQGGAMELLSMIRETVFAFFSDPPIEDISLLLSPVPPTPDTPKTPKSATLPPFGDTRFKFDADNIPPPSPTTGEAWEKYAFWPPYATSLSGAHYLGKILVLVGTAASEMAGLSVMKDSNRPTEPLRILVGGVRERCVQAVTAAWNADAENCKALEDWTRSSEKRELTNMPAHFAAFESSLLNDMQKILYVSEAANRPGLADVLGPPPAKLIQMVRAQFVASLYKALSGMVENAEREKRVDNEGADDDADGLATPARGASATDVSVSTVDSSKKNIRLLVTLSNIQFLRSDIIPQLISQFETNFSVKLTDETKTIRDVLAQIETRLFQAYVSPIAASLNTLIHAGITSPTWVPKSSRPADAQPYVYNTLLSLVLVHTEVSTTAPPLTSQVLKYLLEQVSSSLINAFKQRPRYTLPALMQATLDVEFMAQTLNNYTTDKASEIQSAIYVALDERTDNEARMRLQDELQEMRAILKKLREGTRGEFACFKRQRSHVHKTERPPSKP